MTKLTAVNRILQEAGSRPVGALDSGGASPAGRAEKTLDEYELQVQSAGWHYNTRTNVELTPGGDGKIVVPDDAIISIDSDDYDRWRDVSVVGEHLYDLDNNTDEFSGTLRVTYTLRFPFHCIPQPVAEYIASLAAASYNRRYKGDGDQRLLEREVIRAQGEARKYDNRLSNVNVLDAPDIRETKGRRNRYNWRHL